MPLPEAPVDEEKYKQYSRRILLPRDRNGCHVLMRSCHGVLRFVVLFFTLPGNCISCGGLLRPHSMVMSQEYPGMELHICSVVSCKTTDDCYRPVTVAATILAEETIRLNKATQRRFKNEQSGKP